MMKIKDRKKDDEATQLQKEAQLLLWLVKLFNADPMLALHVSNICLVCLLPLFIRPSFHFFYDICTGISLIGECRMANV